MTHFVTAIDGVRIAYDDIGTGVPVVLVHGFASDRAQNWKNPGWYAALGDAGYRVIAADNRGHGESDRRYDPAAYAQEIRVADVLAVMDAAGVGRAAVMGYSMGAAMAIELALTQPERVERLMLGGVGETYFSDRGQTMQAIAAAMEAPSLASLSDPLQRLFRRFAEQPGKDLKALAACIRSRRNIYAPAQLAGFQGKVLVVCGSNDPIAGPPGPLAAAFPQGRAVTIAKRDHNTVVGDQRYKDAVLAFLAEAA